MTSQLLASSLNCAPRRRSWVPQWLAVVPLAMCTAVSAGAQGATSPGEAQSADVRRRNDCRMAQQVLETGHPAPKYDWALNAIARCPGEAGGALAAAWHVPPDDSTRLRRIVYESSAFADRRVLQSVLVVARQATAPRLARYAALAVLAAYVDSTAVVQLADFDAPTGGLLGVRTHAYQAVGPEPLTQADREGVVAVVRTLGSDDADPKLRAAARVLGEQLRRRLARL